MNVISREVHGKHRKMFDVIQASSSSQLLCGFRRMRRCVWLARWSSWKVHSSTLCCFLYLVSTCVHRCIYVYIYICTHMRTYIHNTYGYVCMHTYVHAYIPTYMHTCIHAYMHTCIHARMHTYIHMYIVYICIHMFIHIHTYICI